MAFRETLAGEESFRLVQHTSERQQMAFSSLTSHHTILSIHVLRGVIV